MSKEYQQFLENKLRIEVPTGIAKPKVIHDSLFPFQKAIVTWALKRGRCALFEGTGLGKTRQQLEFARRIEEYTKRPFLILAPLTVSHQTIEEAEKALGVEVKFAHEDSDIGERGIYITNYGKLHKFDGDKVGGMAADESSIIKATDSATFKMMCEQFANTQFKLCCTASPSPNDDAELGQHAEFLGIMSMNEMLATFFVHDGGETQKWRLKGHARQDFWKWLASWSVCITKPSDIGYSDEGYILPPLKIHEIVVETGPMAGELFPMNAVGLDEQRQVRRETMDARIDKIAKLANSDDDYWCFWSSLNPESEAVTKAVNGCVEVTGSDSDESKEKKLLDFAHGKIKRISTKAKIAGWGMNFQHCNNCVMVGIDHSYESMYQLIRRFWRFGQKREVNVYIVMSDRDRGVLANIRKKEAMAEKMARELAMHMSDITKAELKGSERTTTSYNPKKEIKLPIWLKSE